MLSYRHAFHAGNHADVLKHAVLLGILDYLTRKDKPLRYIETHAGAATYSLRSPEAQQNREHEAGVGKLWTLAGAPPLLARYLDLVRRCNRDAERLTTYPGSSWLARQVLREHDSLFLYELHPTEYPLLRAACREDARVEVRREDGLRGCIGLLPPPERRGVVFIDPSYEVKEERPRVLETLRNAQRRFATGVFVVWHPIVERRAAKRFERALRAAVTAPTQVFELSVLPDRAGYGMTGSRVIVVNPPWKLMQDMRSVLPVLARELGVAASGRYRAIALTDAPRRSALRPQYS
jgi:23S rRNA (adenine2030-N6)-methyltransferase